MIEPFQQDEAFLRDLDGADPGADQFSIWWLAQMGFILQWRGHRLLIDPYLSDSLTRKYADTDKPHVRMTARVIEPGRLERIEAVTASHVHTDHLDPETLRPLAAANPGLRLICPEAIRSVARERSGLPEASILGLDCSDIGDASSNGAPHQVTAGGFTVEAVPAAHERLDRDAQGRLIAIGFLIRFGPWTVYHAGDTVLYDGMADLLRARRVDLALLPINGRKPERRVSGNLWGREAAQLARDLGARCVLPGHFDLFAFNTESPAEFVATCERLNQPFAVLQNGQRWDSTALT
jgi:L-ascorbate metabolism protein UlaG (beta-lactamase superfamily)